MKIVFMGTPEYATAILRALFENNFKISAVFTQPDKPVGRKQILTPPDVKKFLLESHADTPIFQPSNIKTPEIAEKIGEFSPDFIIVAAYGQILPLEILEICPCINLHASILPKFRGASPIQSAILEGEKISGVTAMKMGAGLDDGDILGFSFCGIQKLDESEVFHKFGNVAAKLCIKILQNFDDIAPLKQKNVLSSKCKKIKKTDGLVKFSDSADEILAKFSAFKTWPGIFLENGTKLLEIRKFSDEKKEFGKISHITKDGFTLAVKDGEIEILKLQEPSKKAILARDFINGKRLKIGDRIS